MSSVASAPDHLDPAKWADMLGLFFFRSFFSHCRIPLAANNTNPFLLGLVSLSPDSSLKIQDETERELVFQEKFVSILTLLLHYFKPYAIAILVLVLKNSNPPDQQCSCPEASTRFMGRIHSKIFTFAR